MEEYINMPPKFFDGLKAGYLLLNELGTIKQTNNAFCRMSGYSSDDLLDKQLNDLQADFKATDQNGFIAHVIETGRQLFIAHYRHKNGRLLDFKVQMQAVSNNEDRYIACLLEPLNNDKKERTSSEISQPSILEKALDAIISVNSEGEITAFNKAAEQMFGCTKAEIMGRPLADAIIPKKYRQSHNKGMKRYLQTGEQNVIGQRVELEAMRADGTIFPVEISINRAGNTEPPMFTAFMRDITERLKNERQVKESLKEKQVMLQEIHHRVKNNMAVVSGLLELKAMNTDDKRLQTALKESQMRINSMAMVHEKLYGSESLSEIDFSEYIKDLSESIIATSQSDRREVTVRFKLDNVSLNVNQAIPCGLILNELITNAFEHAFEGQDIGTILIKLVKNEKNIRIIIEDNGSGLPEDFKINKQNTLGITLVKTLTKQLDGELCINEGRAEAGTCFEITFTAE